MNAAMVAQILGAIGFTALVTELIRWLAGRRKSSMDAAAVLSDKTLAWATEAHQRAHAAHQRAELLEQRLDAAETYLTRLERQITTCPGGRSCPVRTELPTT